MTLFLLILLVLAKICVNGIYLGFDMTPLGGAVPALAEIE